MANNQNLRACTPEEARERGRKGGLASAKKRQARKTLREELLALLSDGDVQKRISLALIDEAINGNASKSVARAFETLRDTIGEKPVDKVMVAEIDQSVVDEIENAVLNEKDL